ncbi:G1/S-specific cyclin-D2-like [Panonychus citri]|uniref:G1/S-specific cyclin-D2-like n=1 Tax=Panonychus citri TaxID=50023 RepID=UPI0023075D38|nr:G1/S-specific cyclin-D2-like [Panonychus citri]
MCNVINNSNGCRSIIDPTLIDDERILTNLLLIQNRYVIKSSYFHCVQPDLSVSMRECVANWMLEICEEEQCEKDVFPLAMNILDRFLSSVTIKKSQLQLLASVCLFLASKLKQSESIVTSKLILYSDFSITEDQLKGWELLVLSQLKWDLAAVTPNDFLNLLIRRLHTRSKGKEKLMTIKKHAQTFITLCATDFRFSMLPPSSIAASCIATAILGLTSLRNNLSSTKELLSQLCKLTSIDFSDLLSIRKSIEDILNEQISPHH